MPFSMNCPECHGRLKVPDNFIGKKIKCPTCGGIVVAQPAEPAERAAPPAAAPAAPPVQKKPVEPPPKKTPLPRGDAPALREEGDLNEAPPREPPRPERRAAPKPKPKKKPAKPTGPVSFWNWPLMLALGAFLGLLLLPAAGALLFWFEDKAIKTAVSLQQGAGLTLSVSAERVDAANEGKLVHLSGAAGTEAGVTDPVLGISARALRLKREVEVYQWKEEKKESKKDGKTTVTYTYALVWSDKKPPASSGFTEPKGHDNPKDKPYPDANFTATDVKVGAFTLTPGQVNHLEADTDLVVTPEMLAGVPENLQGLVAIDAEGRLFVSAQPGSTPDAPRVGDARIRYRVSRPQVVTVVARQSHATFEPYTPEAGEKVDLIRPGTHSAQEMFEAAQASAEAGVWLFRVVGFALLGLGFFLVLRRRRARAAGQAPSGILAHVGLGLLAACFALPIVLLAIGGRWVYHRPLIGGGLLGGGVVFLLGVFLLARRRKAEPEPESAEEEAEEDVDGAGGLEGLELVQYHLSQAIDIGAPTYNAGDVEGCYRLYAATARKVIDTVEGADEAKRQLRAALKRCAGLSDPDEQAWCLRHAFDAILAQEPG
jgi:hypothetical protein